MKKISLYQLLALSLALGLLLLAGGCASTAPPKSTLSRINAGAVQQLGQAIQTVLADSAMQQTNAGIKIVSLKTGETLYTQNSNHLFHPASNMKLLTTATALNRLGPNFIYKTTLHAAPGMLRGETLSGDLYLRGTGNPDLLSDDLRWMAGQLKAQGVTQVSGNLICDNRYMDDLFWGSGWMWDDVSDWYWAPISALTVNDNCVMVTVQAGENPGDSLSVNLDPPTAYIKIVNTAFTAAGSDSAALDSFKVQRVWKKPENTIIIQGGRRAGSGPRSYIIDVLDAELYCGTLLRELLAKEGITIGGKIQPGSTPDSSLLLVEHKSAPLSAVIFNTNKVSDNLSAELLLKTVAAEHSGQPGTARAGISQIYQFLQELGVDSSSYRLADGSGVSRYNVITPDLMIELLRRMHTDFRVQAEFKASLPIAGVDGTLENRMKNGQALGKLRAKTGSLSGVSALAGYTTTAEGEELAFSIIMEHFVVPTSRIRLVQDKIADLISDFRRENAVTATP